MCPSGTRIQAHVKIAIDKLILTWVILRTMISLQEFSKRKRLSRSRIQQLVERKQIKPRPKRYGAGKGFWLIDAKAKIVRRANGKRKLK